MDTSQPIEKALEAARRQLLDLTLMNPLLNQRRSRARGVSIHGESAREVFRILWKERRGMTFASAPQGNAAEGADGLGQPEGALPVTGQLTDTVLQTPHGGPELQTRLVNTSHHARIHLEERGTSPLFLALGFLKWFDPAHPGRELSAPTLLLPVTLERRSANSRFVLSASGEDPAWNLSLLARMEGDFGLRADLPEPGDDLDLTAAHQVLREAVGATPGWRVEEDQLELGLFSFARLLMYRDLDPTTWPEDRQPHRHPIIGGLLGAGLPQAVAVQGPEPAIDELVRPGGLHLVVDADSSQTRVLLDARTGATFVVQGPPGTGKSQTITNLIADAVGQGRKVLFVAEKMAALEVVKKRLDHIGLGDACLELHSDKAQKRAVIRELERTWSLGRPRVPQAAADRARLELAVARLNAHADAMNRPIGESGLTPHEVFGQLIGLARHPEFARLPRLRLPAAPSWSHDRWFQARAAAQDWQARIQADGGARSLPFYGARRMTCSPGEAEDLAPRVRAVQSDLIALRRASDDLSGLLGLPAAGDLPGCAAMIGEARRAAPSPETFFGAQGRRVRPAAVMILFLMGLVESSLAVDGQKREAGDLRAVLERIGTKWWRFFLPSFWRSKRRGPALWREVLASAAERSEDARTRFSRSLGDLLSWLEFDETAVHDGRAALTNDRFDFLEERLFRWADGAKELVRTVAHNQARRKASDAGLAGLFDDVDAWPDAGTLLGLAVERARLEALRDAAWVRPEIAQWDRASHERSLADFRALDLALIGQSRAEVLGVHHEGLPKRGAGGQVAVLEAEFTKQRRHLPLRQLFTRASQAILAVKPVFMMSPMSVAAFLPPGSVHFDLVIFDEASQVRPVDAFGALLRANQAIVVGDRQQMPPTRFFDSLMGTEEAAEDEPATSDYESVLDLFVARGAPQRMLEWHYRSRHESLIAVSNREFYGDRLMVFPSPDRSRSDLGLVHHHLPGSVYERGTGQVNAQEAAAVAAAVMGHARNCPSRTLGVAALNMNQSALIMEELEKLRRADPSCEEFFTRAHPAEPFFVKNLETVQGDERDVILISLGYGRDAAGQVSMNFGPLNRAGGERRLNVLISRARLRCEVFTNLTGEDIVAGPVAARGLVVLKSFLGFARSGVLSPAVPGAASVAAMPARATSMPAMPALAASGLRARGLEVTEGLGTARFELDLALGHPTDAGRFGLGVMFDGPVYHRAQSARDRDRLRPSVLEGLGWRLHHVWSRDFLEDAEAETNRMHAALEAAVAHRETATDGTPGSHLGSAEPAPAPIAPAACVIEREEAPAAPVEPVAVPYRLAALPPGLAGLELGTEEPSRVAAWMAALVEVESPIHLKAVCDRIVKATGARRTGARMTAVLEAAVAQAVAGGRITRRGDFLWRAGHDDVEALRSRELAAEDDRRLDFVAPEELDCAILEIVGHSCAIGREELARRVVREAGFRRVTPENAALVATRVDDLVGARRLKELGDRLMS